MLLVQPVIESRGQMIINRKNWRRALSSHKKTLNSACYWMRAIAHLIFSSLKSSQKIAVLLINLINTFSSSKIRNSYITVLINCDEACLLQAVRIKLNSTKKESKKEATESSIWRNKSQNCRDSCKFWPSKIWHCRWRTCLSCKPINKIISIVSIRLFLMDRINKKKMSWLILRNY